ncbi:hypothetical protein [Nonomuraea roseoviolacea]|uniref:hypothetical protein n=1 Tax=Nonomuraea roseoviolacea TaxID=103837 RepID=UPI0031DE1364
MTYTLDYELAEDIAALFGNGWKVTLERDYEGEPELSCYKDGTSLEFQYGKGEGRVNGSHFYSRANLQRYARMGGSGLVDY